jgi:YYY domain-containing protein
MSERVSRWSRPGLWVLAVVLFAAAVRLPNINWDQNHFFHPDERAVAFAVGRLSFQPLNLDPDFFAYGSLPIYLAKATSSAAALIDPHAASYDGVIANGRRLSAVIGSLTVLLLILLGRRLYGRNVGLLAGFLLAACVLHVQNSRFMTVDVTLTFFVLLALAQLVRVTGTGRTRDFALAGVCIGLATATKFSALPLLGALGVAALHRCFVERRFFPVAASVVVAVVAAFLAFAVAEPYGLLRFDRFYHDIVEQSHMVRNAGDFPYTTQYMNTPKYAYEIVQLVVWCMGPLLGLAALWGTGSRIVSAWRTRRPEEWVLLAWVIPFFLVTGWFEVKFPRYLLPIYPFLILWAAEWLLRTYRGGSRLGRVALPAVVVGTLATTAAFVSLYTRPHTVVAASEWTYRHIPPGSKILTQDWDEGFPMPLPGANASQYTVKPFGYYGRPDSEAKIRRLSNELATADYIVFQTKRLYGAVTRAPERFPNTNNYFYQLFAGDLGYTLVHEVAARPSLFGYEIPDELADESLTVYDHPKVLVFKNTGRLAADDLARKILNDVPSIPLTRDDLLLARPSGEESWEPTGAAEPIRSGLTAFLLFAVLVEVLGLAAYPLLRPWLPGVGAYAMAKTLGLLLFAYVSWLLVSVAAASFQQGALLAVAVGIVAAGALAWKRGAASPPARSEVIATELFFWGGLLFFLGARLYNPEVYWGEKPMDFSFLNALTRTTTLPPPEPWFAGSPLNYSYFGYYIVAALGKALHVHPALMFNLGIALFAGLTCAAAFAAGALITGRWQTGALAAFFTTLIGNLAGPIELARRFPDSYDSFWTALQRTVNFDYFWATSRVIEHTINEFPLWSFLFADLHAHAMVMPLSLTFLGLTIAWVRMRILEADRVEPRGTAVVLLLLLGLALGSVFVTNAWSSPTYVLFFPFIVGAAWLTEGGSSGVFRFFGGAVARVLVPTTAVAGAAYVFYMKFWEHFTAPERNWGWENGAAAPPLDFLTIFGLYLFVLVPFLLALWIGNVRWEGKRQRLRTALVVVGLALLGVTLAVSTRAFLSALFLLGLQTLLAPGTAKSWRVPVAMATFAFAVTAGCDIVYVWDRMNTIFKFYLESWFLLAIAAAAAAEGLWSGTVRLPRLRPLWKATLAVLVLIAVFTAASGTFGVVRTNRVRTPTPTLDGMAYLVHKAPHEGAAFNWLNRNIRGIPVLLEAHGDSYQEYTRVSMNTGLPTVLGWGYHVFQRAHTWPDINRRKADIQAAYTSQQKEVVAAVLDRYHVALVFVGSLERRTYSGANLENFKEWDDLLSTVYENPGVSIFAVRGRFAGMMPVTTIEAVKVQGEEGAPKPQDAPGRVQQPRGVAIAPNGHVLVADFGNHRIQELDGELAFVRTWGKLGELPGEFKEPCGVAVDAENNVYVADTWNHRVQVFFADGKYAREWAAGFYGPRGIAIDASGTVFVSDTGNNRIVRFSSMGIKETEWGSKGDAPGQFLEPHGITVDADGNVYVCDNGNSRLQIFDRDGEFISTFPVPGWRSGVFSEPKVTLDADGTIWVTVPAEKQLRAYDRDGRLRHTVGANTLPGVTFETPMGITYDAKQDDFVVTDLGHRVLRVPHAER